MLPTVIPDVIPLSRSVLDDAEARAVAATLATGRLVQGEQVARFQALVAAYTGRRHALAVSSGTAALQLALEALGIGRGDAVLVPDLTWPSPAHAVLGVGATPVLVDVDAAEWNAGPEGLRVARRPDVRAAIVIDQFGNPARVAEIAAALPGVPLIVDAACSLGSHVGALACGSQGVIACHSFHPRKVLTTGEGGMCLTDDDALAQRLTELRNHGQSTPGVFARASGNHRMSEVAAAIGVVQMGRLDTMVAERQAIATRYRDALTDLSPQRAPEGARRNEQTFGVLLPEGVVRDTLIAQLRTEGVETGRLSYALHTLPQLRSAAEDAEREGRRFPHATALAERGLALPLYPGLREDAQAKVIAALRRVLK
jgi:perosamine synthetase